MNSEKRDEKFLTKPIAVIFPTIFIDLIGFGIVIALLPFYVENFQATPLDKRKFLLKSNLSCSH